MRKCVLALTVVIVVLFTASCGGGAPAASNGEAPELLRAVPSDALSVGVFSRLEKGLPEMVDSNSVLFNLDYGKLSRARAAVALCNVGSLAPLLVIEAGKAGADTLDAAAAVIAAADSLKISSSLVTLQSRNALLLSPSATVITVCGRHLAAETSILDAPDFGGVVDALTGSDAIIYRNSGASKLLDSGLCSVARKDLAAFLKDACEWTVVSREKVSCVQPVSEKYFCNFLSSIEEAPSKLAAFYPSGAEFIADLPVASVAGFRKSYEAWRDARVELEQYRKTIGTLSRKTGKDPLAWEKELGVKEVVYVAAPGYRINMLRVSKQQTSEGVTANPYTGFVSALYGGLYNAADSCVIRTGNWIVSGERSVLDTLSFGAVKPEVWPAKTKAVADMPGRRINYAKDNITIWHSNR